MRPHSVDYKRRGDGAGHWFSRGFWLNDTPRLAPVCRLFGHKAVVDGYGPNGPGLHASRWVVCDRCGLRPDPQGRLDPDRYDIGQRYRGPRRSAPPADPDARWNDLVTLKDDNLFYPPGPWPKESTGVLGGQLVFGGPADAGWGVSFKVGNPGSEHTLAASFKLGRLAALYLHTERHGAWWQRRLNNVGYESKVVSLQAHNGRLHWRLWVDRDRWSKSTPWWREGSLQIDPRSIVLGPKRYAYTDVGEPVAAVVRLPHGDDHDVLLQLQRVTFGRKRGRKKLSWSVDWDAVDGIPTGARGGDRVCGSGVNLSDRAAAGDSWALEAAAAIAVQISAIRARNDWSAAPAPI